MTLRIVFDLDGTLLDSLADIAETADQVLAERGSPGRSLADYKRFIGDGVRVLMARASPADRRADREIDAAAARFAEIYAGRWSLRTRPYPTVVETLAELVRRGARMAVLSNKPQAFTRQCVDHFFPGVPFDAIVGQRDGVPPKPDPAGALAIASDWKAAPSQCWYVGDSSVDMRTARGAGMFAIGATWGFRDREELLAEGAQVLIDSLAELIGMAEKTWSASGGI